MRRLNWMTLIRDYFWARWLATCDSYSDPSLLIGLVNLIVEQKFDQWQHYLWDERLITVPCTRLETIVNNIESFQIRNIWSIVSKRDFYNVFQVPFRPNKSGKSLKYSCRYSYVWVINRCFLRFDFFLLFSSQFMIYTLKNTTWSSVYFVGRYCTRALNN